MDTLCNQILYNIFWSNPAISVFESIFWVMMRLFYAIRTGDGNAEEKIDEVFQALIAEQEEQGQYIYTVHVC